MALKHKDECIFQWLFTKSRKARTGRRAAARDLDFQVTAEKCRDCDGLKVLSWTEGVQGAVVHQLCRLRPLCKAAAARPSLTEPVGVRVGRWPGCQAVRRSDSATLTMFFSRVIPPPPFFTGRPTVALTFTVICWSLSRLDQ